MTLLLNHRKDFAKRLFAGFLMATVWGLNAGTVQGQDALSSGQGLSSSGLTRSDLTNSELTGSELSGSEYTRPELSGLSNSCNNYISITGETNINMFSLDQFVPDDLICGAGDSRWIQLPDEELYLIRIPVRNFEASNRIVYKDFLEMIDVKEHPYIHIFMDESEFGMLFQDRSFFLPRIGISVAGTTRYYQVPCQVSNCIDGKISVSGHKTLKLTDFKLAPPQKTMGLIKVQNELIINFEFSLPSESGINLSKI